MLALALTAGLPVAAEAAPTVIVGSQTIEGGSHTFTEQLIVAPGSTLTIKDATIFLDVPRSCPIGGSFEFCHPSLFVMPGATLITRGATFDTHLPVTINPASGGYTVYAYAGVLDIEDTTFIHARTVGGEAPGATVSTVRNSTFTQSLYPITMIRGMQGIIEGNTIVDSRQGIHMRDADSVIRNNTIEVIGNGIDVQATLVGGMSGALTTRALVEGNTVRGGLRAFFSLTNYAITVRDNVFEDAVIGAVFGVITGDDIRVEEPVTFENNLLRGNETGVYSYANVHGGQEQPIEITVPLRQNSIVESECSSATVNPPGNGNVHLVMDARSNWWGSAAGPQSNGQNCPAIVGDVLFDPWLSSAPV